MKLEEEIDEIITSCWTEEIHLIEGSETSAAAEKLKERFEVMMSDEDGWALFAQNFISRKLKSQIIIPSKAAYHNISILFMIILNQIDA